MWLLPLHFFSIISPPSKRVFRWPPHECATDDKPCILICESRHNFRDALVTIELSSAKVAKRGPVNCRSAYAWKKRFERWFYLRRQRGGYVFVVVCLSICLLATLRKELPNAFALNCREGWQRANEQMITFWQAIKFWWRSGSLSR